MHYITDAADDSVYWIARAVNARGQLTREQSKNGVTTVSNYNNAKGWLLETRSETAAGELIQEANYSHDKLGNILTRQMSHRAQDSLGLLSQAHEQFNDSFTYDGLDRIRSNRFNNTYNGFSTEQTYNYDAIGNITYKSAVGDYRYSGSCNGITAGPHAVTQTNNASYCYDQNGNMIRGNDRTITYTAFNKPSRITNSHGSDVNFYYGAARSRLIKRSQSATTYYVGIGATGAPLYEKITDNSGAIDHVMFIYAGSYHQGQPFAQRQVHQPINGTDSVEHTYLHRDHLGSVTATTDQSGLLQLGSQIKVKVRSYDVWGNIRVTRDINQVLPLPSLGNLTYTGQESVPEVGLIHMNGRVYDPILGKMLSADPTIPDPSESISYNRYAYVNNNPMRYSDPTGFTSADTAPIETIEINGVRGNAFSAGVASTFLMGGGASSTDIVEQAIAIMVNEMATGSVATGMQTKKKSRASRRRGGNKAWGITYQAPQLTNSGGKFKNGKEKGVKKGQSLEDYMRDKSGKLAITDEERGFSEAGDRIAFWTSRMERGDPIAFVALGIVRNNSFVGPRYVGGRLANMSTGLNGDALNALGVDLMRAHISAVDFDFNNKIGIPGLLSPTQAAAYHHEIFSSHGISPAQFGGTLGVYWNNWSYTSSPNLMRSIWCAGCDYTGGGIQ